MEHSSPFVKMYSTDWCHDCKTMLSFFEEQNVAYKVFHVDSDPLAVEKLKEICGGKKIVPTLEIEGKTYMIIIKSITNIEKSSIKNMGFNGYKTDRIFVVDKKND